MGGLAGQAGLAGLVGLSSCAVLAPPPSAPLLHDALFTDPARPPEADAAMVIDDAMRQSVRGELLLSACHVNLVLAPRFLHWRRYDARHAGHPDAMQIDFLPPELVRGLRSVPISEQRVLAMYMHKQAVESLQRASLGGVLCLGPPPGAGAAGAGRGDRPQWHDAPAAGLRRQAGPPARAGQPLKVGRQAGSAASGQNVVLPATGPSRPGCQDVGTAVGAGRRGRFEP